MTSRIAVLGTVAVLAALSAGCSGARPSTSPTTAAPGPASGSGTAGLGDRDFASAAPINIVRVSQAFFATPSKNISCDLRPGSVRCDIGRRSWTAPGKPASCSLDYGNGLVLDGTAAATFTCAGDTLLGSSTEILQYGHALRSGDELCDSESAGLRCTDTRTGHGFTISVAAYTVF